MDFIGRVEHFDEDYTALLEKIGMSVSDLVKVNSSHGAGDDSYFKNRDIVEKIKSLYQIDCEIFGYDSPTSF